MSETSGISDRWREWIDHWRFSHLTSFRVSEQLETLTLEWAKTFDKKEQDSIESIFFVRHPIHSIAKEEEAGYPKIGKEERVALSQFTQSTRIAGLFSFDEEKIKSSIIALEDKLQNFQKWLLKKGLDTWKLFLENLAVDVPFSENELNFSLLKDPKIWAIKVDSQELIGSLYLAYSLATHKGFLTDNLNEWHLLGLKGEDAASVMPDTLGYLLVTEEVDGHPLYHDNSLPEINEAWRISHDKNVKEVLPQINLGEISGNRNKQTSRQKELSWFRGGYERKNAKLGKLFELFFELFQFFNEGADTESEIFQLVVPVYAWQRVNKENNCRNYGGVILGWAFHRVYVKPEEWPESESELSDSLFTRLDNLRRKMRLFSHLYQEEETEWALDREWKADDTPSSFMEKHFHHSCGWVCEGVTSKELNEYFKQVGDDEALELRVDLQRSVRGASSNEVAVLRPNSLCIIPKDETARKAYFSTVAEHARYFYDRCLAIQAKREEGRISAAAEAYTSSAHQLRKLIRHIDKSSSAAALNALRNYFGVIFLSPRNLYGQAGVRIATDIFNDSFGGRFLKGSSVKDFITNSYEYARELQLMTDLMHNTDHVSWVDALCYRLVFKSKTYKHTLNFDQSIDSLWGTEIAKHDKIVAYSVDHGSKIDGDDLAILQTKIFAFAALVAVWLNSIEHSDAGSEIKIEAIDNSHLKISNKVRGGEQESRQQNHVRSLGTEQTLQYYFTYCFPEGVLSPTAQVEFLESPNEQSWFETTIPFPWSTLCQN